MTPPTVRELIETHPDLKLELVYGFSYDGKLTRGERPTDEPWLQLEERAK